MEGLGGCAEGCQHLRLRRVRPPADVGQLVEVSCHLGSRRTGSSGSGAVSSGSEITRSRLNDIHPGTSATTACELLCRIGMLPGSSTWSLPRKRHTEAIQCPPIGPVVRAAPRHDDRFRPKYSPASEPRNPLSFPNWLNYRDTRDTCLGVLLGRDDLTNLQADVPAQDQGYSSRHLLRWLFYDSRLRRLPSLKIENPRRIPVAQCMTGIV